MNIISHTHFHFMVPQLQKPSMQLHIIAISPFSKTILFRLINTMLLLNRLTILLSVFYYSSLGTAWIFFIYEDDKCQGDSLCIISDNSNEWPEIEGHSQCIVQRGTAEKFHRALDALLVLGRGKRSGWREHWVHVRDFRLNLGRMLVGGKWNDCCGNVRRSF